MTSFIDFTDKKLVGLLLERPWLAEDVLPNTRLGYVRIRKCEAWWFETSAGFDRYALGEGMPLWYRCMYFFHAEDGSKLGKATHGMLKDAFEKLGEKRDEVRYIVIADQENVGIGGWKTWFRTVSGHLTVLRLPKAERPTDYVARLLREEVEAKAAKERAAIEAGRQAAREI